MWALEHPRAARTGRLFADTPAALLAVLAVGAVASLALARLAVLPPPTVAIAVLTAGHGALLATALAWARQPSRTAALAAGLIGLAAVASGLGAFGPLRYLVDPLLPMRAELVVGAVFYLALLGAINCWLLWWSESLVPGLLSALIFFTAYRALGPA